MNVWLCLFLFLAVLCEQALALSLDAYSSAQLGYSNGTYELGSLANGGFNEKILGVTGGFSMANIGVGAHAEATYTDAVVPAGYNPTSTGMAYPLPTGRSLRYGLQARFGTQSVEAMATYFAASEFAGKFRLGGTTHDYSYTGVGYRADVGFRISGPLWLRVGYAIFEMDKGKSSLSGGPNSLSEKLKINEYIVSLTLHCSWRDKCFRGRR